MALLSVLALLLPAAVAYSVQTHDSLDASTVRSQ